MARSIKRGLDYFSVDVDMFADRKVKRVLHACGAQAMAVLLKMWCIAYDERGYYAAPDSDFFYDISSELGLGEDYIKAVLEKSVESGLFDSGLYERCGILTSQRMQNNFLDATRKRVKNNSIAEDHLLLAVKCDDEGLLSGGTCIPSGGTCIPSDGTCMPSGGTCIPSGGTCMPSGGESTQSKVKQTKEEESKQEHEGGGGILSFGEYVHMSQSEYGELCNKFGDTAVRRMTEMLGLYKASTGKQYASDYHAILSWVVKRWQEESQYGGRGSFERPIGNYDHLAIDPFADEDG